MSKRTFSGKKILLEEICFGSVLGQSTKVFGRLTDVFQRGCQNCMLLVNRNTSRRKFIFEKTVFSFIFGQLAKMLHRFAEKSLTWLSKLHFTCPQVFQLEK